MKSSLGKSLAVILFILMAVFWLGGCSAKGYITATVGTVIGLDVSENPKTQVPHVRFGYVRSHYYYIPTGKSKGETTGQTTARADETPSLVSEIYVNAKFLSGTVIQERFAVGEAAKTEAANLMFGGVSKMTTEPDVLSLKRELNNILRDPEKVKYAKENCIPVGDPDANDPKGYVFHTEDRAKLQKFKDCLQKSK